MDLIEKWELMGWPFSAFITTYEVPGPHYNSVDLGTK